MCRVGSCLSPLLLAARLGSHSVVLVLGLTVLRVKVIGGPTRVGNFAPSVDFAAGAALEALKRKTLALEHRFKAIGTA